MMNMEDCAQGKTVNMEEMEKNVQKLVVNFCKLLPEHVEKWTLLLSETTEPVHAIGNYSEQLRHVERANIKYIENFTEIQETLMCKLYFEIEEEIKSLRCIVDQLNQTVSNLRNKLTLLERSTFDLNWESNSSLILGSPVQPPLSRILEEGFNFVSYFSGLVKRINEHLKVFNIRREDCMREFENSFTINLDKPCIESFLAIVQYVDNEKNLT